MRHQLVCPCISYLYTIYFKQQFLLFHLVEMHQTFVDHLCYLCLVFVLHSCLFIAALWSHAGKGLTSWLLFVMSNCDFVTFPCGILGQVRYLIVLIPDLCRLSYFHRNDPLAVPLDFHSSMHDSGCHGNHWKHFKSSKLLLNYWANLKTIWYKWSLCDLYQDCPN